MASKNKQAIAERYQKLSPIEHVLVRSSMYIGSVEPDTCDLWTFDDDTSKMVKRTVKYNQGLYKIFDEILVNAIDHCARLKALKASLGEDSKVNLLKNIRVNVSKETGIICVENDGDGIDIVQHPTYHAYVPEIVFGHMLSSTNYDDSEERIIGGQNGLGAKVCNIFSKEFNVETVDAHRKLIYKQKFEKNMSMIGTPIIEKYSKKPYTRFTFVPDFDKFSMKDGLTDDMYHIMRKRVFDACACTDSDVNIYFNDTKLEYKTFERYADLYLGEKTSHTRIYETVNDRWEVIASYNQFNGFEQVSFVNGINTIRGGKHVEYITNQIVKKLTELIQKKKKDVTIKPASIKDNMFLLVKSTIVNPTFDSQSKETLTTPMSKFGSKAELSDKFIEKLYKSGIVEKVLEISDLHDNKKLQKTDGKKQTKIRGLPKLEDAPFAGGPHSKECILLLTEGDSAASMAISGLAGLSESERNLYGCFPLKGKLMNVKDQSVSKIADNDEITALKKILGIESGKDYSSVEDLRYGKICLMTDADCDGYHIRALCVNLVHSLWPSLIKNCNFISAFLTPIVKVKKGTINQQFFNLADYNTWFAENNDGKGWEIRYLKGLGTSSAEEAKQYFRDMNVVNYIYTPNESDHAIDLAFNKKKADERKQWLSHYDRNVVLDFKNRNVTLEDMINKELIHFSTYDVERSIPNIMDGLKTSQRKIMFSCFKKNLISQIKVAQLAGYVSEVSAYHHGEASLQSAIISMAQDFVGANNLPLLKGNGMFGTRRMGGADASQPRYIFTLLNQVTPTLFKKEDFNVLTYINDDGMLVEPLFYTPTLPTILINGSIGIGTGFSCNIPSFNPHDIIIVIKKLMAQENVDDIELVPWYRGFKGTIEKNKQSKFVSRGTFKKVTATRVDVLELPVGTWILDFKEHLEEYMDKNPTILKKYDCQASAEDINFSLYFANSTLCDDFMRVEDNGFTKFENEMKLVSTKGLSVSNMHLFNSKCQITKYDTVIDIIKEFYTVRIDFYEKRREALLKQLKYDNEIRNNKIRFIKEVVAEHILVHKMRKDDLESKLHKDDYMTHDDKYDYILRIPIYNLTIDKVDEIENEKSKADSEIDRITSLNVNDWWKEDIEQFEAEYNKYLNVKSGSMPDGASTSKKNKKMPM